MCCSVLQCIVVRCSDLQCVAVFYREVQCVAVCCSVLQCVLVCEVCEHPNILYVPGAYRNNTCVRHESANA